MGTPLSPVFVLSRVTVTFQDVLEATVAGILVAHPGARMNPEGADLIIAPTHGLKRWVVITQLSLPSQEVLTLKDAHLAVAVVSAGDWSERGHPLNMVGIAAAPGLPAWVFASFQNELLPLEASVLVANPRATLDFKGADGFKSRVHNIGAFSSELVPATLEAFFIPNNDLPVASKLGTMLRHVGFSLEKDQPKVL